MNSLPPSEPESFHEETQRLSSSDFGSEKDSKTTPTNNDVSKGIDTVEPSALTERDSGDAAVVAVPVLRALVALKDQIYAVLRQVLADIVTIVQRSATKARDWAVEDEAGQLISSALALVGFFSLVAAFAVWNISVLSGGKSVWAGPTNGITVPVIRGLPPPDIATRTTSSVKFQKPKWKLPKIQTSYGTSSRSTSNSSESSMDRIANIPTLDSAKEYTKP